MISVFKAKNSSIWHYLARDKTKIFDLKFPTPLWLTPFLLTSQALHKGVPLLL